jgi:hypothetical protein
MYDVLIASYLLSMYNGFVVNNFIGMCDSSFKFVTCPDEDVDIGP